MSNLIQESLFFSLMISLIGYELGLYLKKKTKIPVCNPLLISIIFVILILKVLNIPYDNYKEGSSLLSYLLTPATVCLAIPLYRQLELLKKNMMAIIVGIAAGVATSLVSVLLLSKLFQVPRNIYVTLLPKSITTAIGMGISEELGGVVTITVAVIIITGVLGNIFAETVCKFTKITHPIAKGIAIGTSSHAVGTTKAMELGEIEGAMSSLAIAVAGLMTVIGASFFGGFY